MKYLSVILFLTLSSGLFAASDLPQDFQLPPAPGRFIGADGNGASRSPVRSGDPTVATTYFYWYDIDSKSHFFNPDGSDALTTHPVSTEGMSWKNPQWHATQYRQMSEAGIDVALPVYWGSPTIKQHRGNVFSDEGVPPMVEALDTLTAAGEKAPTLGMFYDTSSLEHNIGPYRVDLTTDAGKRWFYGTIRNFFSMIPPKHRATIDEKPLVFLYAAAFAKDVDETLFPTVRDMFRKDFGSDLYIVKAVEWPGKADSIYQWGAAVSVQMYETAAIGPGYDHSAVPNRTPLINPRDDGKYYTIGWERLLKMYPGDRPFLVHLETWNEFHEGTDICESKEYGTQYLELTKKFTEMFHAKKRIDTFSVGSRFPEPYASPGNERGIKPIDFAPPGDGPIRTVAKEVGDQKTKVWTTVPLPEARFPGQRYFYFDVDSTFLLEPVAAVELRIVFQLGPGTDRNSLAVHYDSRDPNLSGIEQVFRGTHPDRIEKQGDWNIAVFRMPYPRFENRANGADFRLFVNNGELIIRNISLKIVK